MLDDLTVIEMSYKGPNSNEIVDSGQIKQTVDGGWIINAASSFPLTVYGVDQKQVVDLRIMLDSIFYKQPDTVEQLLERFILQTEIRCKEVDDYLVEYREQYIRIRDNFRRDIPDLAGNEYDKDDEDIIRTAFDALEQLDIHPDPDHPDMLFLNPPKPLEVARLIWQTFSAGANDAQRVKELGEYGEGHLFRYWQISCIDACPFCKRAASRIYELNERPKVPLHVGCKCAILGTISKGRSS
jgi:hypothetical protein